MSFDTLTPAWYVLHTRSRFENVVSEGLQKKAIEVFLPRITVASRRKDRKKMIRVPLFPGYLFVRSDLHPTRHLDILKTVGAVKLVGDKQGPISVQEETVQSLRIMVTVEGPISTGTLFSKGQRVLVINGPFAGVIGIFDRYRGSDRVVVFIEALGQFAAAEVDAGDVEPVPDLSSPGPRHR
ncbi:MAG: UpxY family transcription antiterminator [Desulfatitalea sp.]|nr:UpxY family transcription antiterminator [Desulfatitalea sp.]